MNDDLISKQIKTILVNLPIPFVEDDERQPPGGLVSIATYVKSKGYDINVCDLAGIHEKDFLKYIEDADIYGISTYSATYNLAVSVLSMLREKHPNALFVAGGPHASALPDQVSNHFDVAMGGEGEYEWLKLIENYSRGILPSKIIMANPIENLDDLPFPDYEFFCDMNKYTRRIDGVPVMCLDSSRGCNFKCKFCNSVVNKRGCWRGRSADNVYAEIKWHYDNGWRAFRFNDDNFLVDKKRAIKICEMIKNLNIKWRIFARAESLDLDLCILLKEAGCTHVSVGIESLSPIMLQRMGKATSIDRIKTGLVNAHNAGIITRGFFIVGFPGETDDTIEETINQIQTLVLDEATVYPCIAYPGTDLFLHPEQYGITWIEQDYSRYIQVGKEKTTGFVLETEGFNVEKVQQWREQVMTALRECGISWCDERKEVI